MRQLSKVIVLVILIFICIPSSFAAIRGGINYSIPIEYKNLSETELENKARKYYFEALKSADKDDINMTNALVLYNILQNINKESIEYCVKLGILYDKIGKDRYAKSNFSRAISLNSNIPMTYYYFGEFYYNRQLYRNALKYYKKAYDNGYMTNYDTLYKLGDIYQKFGDTKSALRFYSKAYAQNPNSILENKLEQMQSFNSINNEYYSNLKN